MPNFEQEPKKDPQNAMEELRHGRFSMPEDEKERVIKEAIDKGRDPIEALREHQERLDQATARLRESQKEEAIDKLEREINKKFRNKKESK